MATKKAKKTTKRRKNLKKGKKLAAAKPLKRFVRPVLSGDP
jgi:hypothetical protein